MTSRSLEPISKLLLALVVVFVPLACGDDSGPTGAPSSGGSTGDGDGDGAGAGGTGDGAGGMGDGAGGMGDGDGDGDGAGGMGDGDGDGDGAGGTGDGDGDGAGGTGVGGQGGAVGDGDGDGDGDPCEVFPDTPGKTDDLWGKVLGDSGVDEGQSIAVDGSGNVLVTGLFEGDVNFGGGLLPSTGYNDIFLAKYDAAGAHVWSKHFGGDFGAAYGYAVAVDEDKNVLLAGSFFGTVDFGGDEFDSEGDDHVFVAKFGSEGDHIWSRSFAVPTGLTRSIVADDDGNVFMTGTFAGTVNFGGEDLTSETYDVFVAGFDSDGEHLFSHGFGEEGWDEGRGIAVDGVGDLLVTGTFEGDVDFGGGTLTSSGDADVFLAKYEANGDHVWSDHFGATGFAGGTGVAVDGDDNVLVTGTFDMTADFGGGVLTTAGENDVFIAKYDSDGDHVWSERFGGTGADMGRQSAVDSMGNVLVAGGFRNTVNFGGDDLTNAGDVDDVFVAKYDADGDHIWSKHFGKVCGNDFGTGIAVDGDDHALVTGILDVDIFVARYAP